MTVSKCYCFYGYGGEACAQRVVSYVSMLWQVRQAGWVTKQYRRWLTWRVVLGRGRGLEVVVR